MEELFSLVLAGGCIMLLCFILGCIVCYEGSKLKKWLSEKNKEGDGEKE